MASQARQALRSRRMIWLRLTVWLICCVGGAAIGALVGEWLGSRADWPSGLGAFSGGLAGVIALPFLLNMALRKDGEPSLNGWINWM